MPSSTPPETQPNSPRFTWKPLYSELARRLLEYEDRQDVLLGILGELAKEAVPMIGLRDPEPDDGDARLSEIDPFTFFASFNRNVRDQHRRRILERVRERLGLESAVPEDFDGLPFAHNMASWYFGYRANRRPEDIPSLWSLARQAVEGGRAGIDGPLFDRCLAIHGVRMPKLTMGLFWLAPDEFLPCDQSTTRLLSKHGLELGSQDWRGYREFARQAEERFEVGLPQLSYDAYEATPPPAPPDTVVWKIAPEEGARYWPMWRELGVATIGWDTLGDLTEVDEQGFEVRCAEAKRRHPKWKDAGMRQVLRFRNIPVGARIIANRGIDAVVGIGTVTGGYYFDPNAADHKHRLLVRWDDTTVYPVKRPGWRRTLIRLKPSDLVEITRPGPISPVIEDETDFASLLAALEDAGLQFPEELVATYLLALQTKRFVILSGISGTGKTRLALEVARHLGRSENGEERADARTYELIPVRPDWTDARGLLGFHNPLLDAYVLTPALRLVLRAAEEHRRAAIEKRSAVPHFLVLDEMNLARVEHYFSDFLSAMESAEPIPLHDSGAIEEGATGDPVPRRVVLPPNLYVTGTINVDETTYVFSPKVLDRAFTLELDAVDLRGFRPLDATDPTEEEATPLRLAHWNGSLQVERPSDAHWAQLRGLGNGELSDRLEELNDLLSADHRHFGYRVATEIARFLLLAREQAGDSPATRAAALDFALLAKVLVKLHGTQQELGEVLQRLFSFTVGTDGSVYTDWELREGRLSSRNDGTPRFPRSSAKLWRMLRRLAQQGFTSYVE